MFAAAKQKEQREIYGEKEKEKCFVFHIYALQTHTQHINTTTKIPFRAAIASLIEMPRFRNIALLRFSDSRAATSRVQTTTIEVA
jgi:hypothetical protein